LADYFIITSGKNSPQIQALADNCCEVMQKLGVALKHIEGNIYSSWLLLDFGEIIVHIFNHKDREFYDLQRLWGDAKEIK